MPDVGRKALAESLGTALPVATVLGSGIAAHQLSPGEVGLQLLENAPISGAVLVALTLAPAAFNPVVTVAERVHQFRQAGGDDRPHPVRCLRRDRPGSVPMFLLMQLLGGGPVAPSSESCSRKLPPWPPT
jgi:glycerol uptake facilitator-like aquaporin